MVSVYELSIERVFSAGHALAIQGRREPLHDHDWRVTVVVAGPRLDADGLLCDFHQLDAWLDEVIRPLRNRNLSETSPFVLINPSAERVAEHIALEMNRRLPGDGLRVTRVTVTEAPGCAAGFRPDR